MHGFSVPPCPVTPVRLAPQLHVLPVALLALGGGPILDGPVCKMQASTPEHNEQGYAVLSVLRALPSLHTALHILNLNGL